MSGKGCDSICDTSKNRDIKVRKSKQKIMAFTASGNEIKYNNKLYACKRDLIGKVKKFKFQRYYCCYTFSLVYMI